MPKVTQPSEKFYELGKKPDYLVLSKTKDSLKGVVKFKRPKTWFWSKNLRKFSMPIPGIGMFAAILKTTNKNITNKNLFLNSLLLNKNNILSYHISVIFNFYFVNLKVEII